MRHPLTVELSDATYAALQLRADADAQSPAAAAAAALEQHFGTLDGPPMSERPVTEAERQAARERFERHFGEVNLGRATAVDNHDIDADLARAYLDHRPSLRAGRLPEAVGVELSRQSAGSPDRHSRF